jgi:hypothetical protein
VRTRVYPPAVADGRKIPPVKVSVAVPLAPVKLDALRTALRTGEVTGETAPAVTVTVPVKPFGDTTILPIPFAVPGQAVPWGTEHQNGTVWLVPVLPLTEKP